MSYSLFKTNMKSMMDDPDSIGNFQQFGKKLTDEYDLLIKRGFQSQIDSVPIDSANKPAMEQLVNLALMAMLQQKEGEHSIVFEIGKGIIMYWTGASLSSMPPPITPAIGSIVNVSTVSAPVLNSGTFPNLGPNSPTEDTADLIDNLIDAITIHLTTITGLYNTISLYPAVPTPTPAPGVLPWTGFTIP